MARTLNMKPVRPDEVLAAILGTSEPLQRTEITKRLWAYIHEHGLQDATNRRQINAGDSLWEALFGGASSINMFELPKCVSRHVSAVEA